MRGITRALSGPILAPWPSSTPASACASDGVTELIAKKSLGCLQESDRLESLGTQMPRMQGGACSSSVRLVSLGGSCGPKLTFQQLGRGAETLPFDWLRTRAEGVLHFMRTDFESFFDYTTRSCAQGMVMYRSAYHSFWHDNPDDAGMRERYARRIQRFQAIDASQSPVLFVRAANGSEELALAEELLRELKSRFGPKAFLLYIIDYQCATTGAGAVRGLDGLMLYFHRGPDRQPPTAPYKKPVAEALRWAAGQGIAATEFASLAGAVKACDYTRWGYIAHANEPAFEELPGFEFASDHISTSSRKGPWELHGFASASDHIPTTPKRGSSELFAFPASPDQVHGTPRTPSTLTPPVFTPSRMMVASASLFAPAVARTPPTSPSPIQWVPGRSLVMPPLRLVRVR